MKGKTKKSNIVTLVLGRYYRDLKIMSNLHRTDGRTSVSLFFSAIIKRDVKWSLQEMLEFEQVETVPHEMGNRPVEQRQDTYLKDISTENY